MVKIYWKCVECKKVIMKIDLDNWYADQSGCGYYFCGKNHKFEHGQCPVCDESLWLYTDDHDFLQNLIKNYPNDVGIGKKYDSLEKILPNIYKD